jgi:hypothetical protein
MFTAFLLAQNARIQADLVDQLFNSSEKRLARILLLLAQFGKESKPETVVPKISQEVLTEMIGTTRSRVSFFMNRFRKLGFVEYNGEIRVHNTCLISSCRNGVVAVSRAHHLLSEQLCSLGTCKPTTELEPGAWFQAVARSRRPQVCLQATPNNTAHNV